MELPLGVVLETNQEYYDAKDYEEESEVKEESRSAQVDSNGDQEMHYFGDPNDNAKNSQLAIGYKDRSFVIRGSTIGVFGHNERDGLDLQTTITNLSNSNRKTVKPSKVKKIIICAAITDLCCNVFDNKQRLTHSF